MGYMLLCGAGSGGASAPTVTLSTANLLANATSITITGTNFSTTAGNNTVTFNNSVTGTVTSATSTSLTVTSLSGVSSLSNGTSLTAIVTTNGVNSGSAVQVATIQVTPQTILGASLISWLRGDLGTWQLSSLSTPSVADGDPVGGWVDQQSGYNPIQATLANRATLKTAAGANLNGYPVVRFNGTSNFLSSGTFSSALTSSTIVIVANIRSAPIEYGCFFDGITSSNRNAFQCYTASPSYRMYAGSTGPAFTCNVGSWTVINAVFNGASSAVHTNGGSDTTGSAGAQTLTGIALGCEYNGLTYYAAVDLAEVIVATGALSAGQRAQIDTYLNGRYAIY